MYHPIVFVEDTTCLGHATWLKGRCFLAPRAECGYQSARGIQHECGKIMDGNVLHFEDGSACHVKVCIQDTLNKAIFVLAQPLELLGEGLHFSWSKWVLQKEVVTCGDARFGCSVAQAQTHQEIFLSGRVSVGTREYTRISVLI